MSATKREGMTLVFFLSLLSLVPISIGVTRLFMRLRWDATCAGLIGVGGIFLVIVILTLGLED